MGAVVAMVFIAMLVIIAFITALVAKDGGVKGIAGATGIGFGLLGTVVLLFSSTTVVNEGSVGVQQNGFNGLYAEETLDAGRQWHAPWISISEESIQVQEFAFNDNPDQANRQGGAITAQVNQGGNLTYDMAVQYVIEGDSAADIRRKFGDNWRQTLLYSPGRECGRNATSTIQQVEQALTSKRGDIADNNIVCLQESISALSSNQGLDADVIRILDVLVQEVDPGTAVTLAIDEKTAAEQALQTAAVVADGEGQIARGLAIEAFGISNAERLVSCGGVAVLDEETGDVIDATANETCEDQFSQEYLQWLYINQLSEVKGVVILPPEFDGNLFVQTPAPAVPAAG